MKVIDLNCDMGESFGVYKMGNDEAIMPYITSANIACGFHAGDPSTMRRTVQLALQSNVAIGAHPGLPDLIGFGRRNLDLSPQEAYDLVLYQTGALRAFVDAEGGRLQHIKPHGALYNMAGRSRPLAEAIAEAVYDADPTLLLFAPHGSELLHAGRRIGLRTAAEVFADRTYQEDGSLTPRHEEAALILDEQVAVQQVIRMVEEGKVTTKQGTDITIKAETVCIHGDGEHALKFAERIHASLIKAGISIRPAGEHRSGKS